MADAERVRAEMVDTLRRAGRVRTPAVEEALRRVPRHVFLPDRPIAEAYADEAVVVQSSDGVATSSASQPSMMAIMLEQLDLRPGHRVLEIGAGTGYNAALMTTIVGPAGAVTAVDIDEELVDLAAVHLAAARVDGVELVVADGALGHPPSAPYDRIVLTVGSDDVRPEWVAQLAPGGRLLLPLAVRGSQLAIALDLGPDGVLYSDSVRSCAFIRLRGEGASQQAGVPLDVADVVLQVPEDAPDPDPAAVVAALDEPDEPVPAAVPLGPMDMWDGFGLWLALTEPRTCRLLQLDPDAELPGGARPLGGAGGTIAVVAQPNDPLPGLAIVVPASDQEHGRTPGPVSVRPFGLGGPALAARLLAAIEHWAAIDRPEAMNWRFTVVPRGVGLPDLPGACPVVKQHCTVLAELPADSAR